MCQVSQSKDEKKKVIMATVLYHSNLSINETSYFQVDLYNKVRIKTQINKA